MSASREQVLAAARRLFAERGYGAVTVREVAAAADVSPALVMKLAGSKADLFLDAVDPGQDRLDLDRPLAELGRSLVRDVLTRWVASEPEPLARAVVLVLPSPDPEQVRRLFHEAYAAPLTARLGGGEHAARTAALVIGALVGLAVSSRVLRLLGEPVVDECVVEAYGAAVQTIVDRAAGAAAASPA